MPPQRQIPADSPTHPRFPADRLNVPAAPLYDAAMRTPWPALLLAGILPGLLLLPIWPLAGLGAGEDELLYYFPGRMLIQQLLSDGTLPWLNPWNGLDRPLLADPQAALFYPPTWLLLILPAAAAYAVTLWLHYSWAWFGMERLLATLRLDAPARCIGATAFAFGGFLLAHRTHLTMLQSAAWLPWVALCLLRYVERGRARDLLPLAIAAALQCYAGHVQVAALTALGTLVLVVGRAHGLRRWALGWLAAGGLFALQALPTWRFVQICTRTERGFADFIENAWHPLSAVGLLFPMFFGQRTPNWFSMPYWGPSHQVEQLVYPGLLVLALCALAWPLRKDADLRRWFTLLILALLTALGILCPLLYWLPGASLLRGPARAWILVQLAAAVIAAVVVHQLDGRRAPRVSALRSRGLSLSRRPLLLPVDIGLALLLASLLAYPLLSTERAAALMLAVRPWQPAFYWPVLVGALTLVALRMVLMRWQRPAWRWLLLGVLLLDLGLLGWTVDVPAGWRSHRAWLTSLERETWLERVLPTRERVWVVTARHGHTPGEYIRPLDRGVANTNLLTPHANLTDYGPLQPAAYVAAFGFEPWGERKDPGPLLHDPLLLQQCNVGWILLCHDDLPAPLSARPILRTPGGLRLYRLPGARGEAFVEPADVPASVHVEHQAPHRMRVRVDGWTPLATDDPATLVISRLAQPGWSATINGRPTETGTWRNLLLAVSIPRGQLVDVTLRYDPPGLWSGVTITLLTLALLLAYCAADRGVSASARTT